MSPKNAATLAASSGVRVGKLASASHQGSLLSKPT
jgi:hypothetical protein